MWSAKAPLLRSVGGAGAITDRHSGTVAAGKSLAFALHIRISNRTGRGDFFRVPPSGFKNYRVEKLREALYKGSGSTAGGHAWYLE